MGASSQTRLEWTTVSSRTPILVVCLAAAPLLLPLASMGQQANTGAFDPLTALTDTFPKSITLSKANTVLEFCHDDTCDGFVAAKGTQVSTLRDFAYLYEYFFSDYSELSGWRKLSSTIAMANRVLSKADYRNCMDDMPIEAARCVLLGISRKGSIRLTFVRFDERTRNVEPMDVVKELEKR
jgi:hypothetical protein